MSYPEGIDVSLWQGDISAVLKTVAFAFVKVSDGNSVDPKGAYHLAQATAAGVVRGAYHFAHPSNDSVAEADHFLGYVRQHGLLPGDMLALDLEVTDGEPAARVAAFGRAWCARVQAQTGRKPLVYTFLSFAEAGNCAGLGNYPLWIADPSSTPGRPRIPAPWSSWAVHQYGQQGIDLDVASYPGSAAMSAALGQPAPPPKPAPKGWTAAMIADLPELAEGADDAHLPHWYVTRAQLILNGVFHAVPQLAEDGKFGPVTANAIGVMQCDNLLPVTRKLDAATWTLLLAAVKP